MTHFEIYQAMGDIDISFIEFAVSLDGWDLKQVFKDGEIIAFIKFQGPEFHFHSFGNHSFTRREIQDEVFIPLWKEYGYARTKTPKSDVRQQRFNERAGFFKIGEDDTQIHYQINKEASKCQ